LDQIGDTRIWKDAYITIPSNILPVDEKWIVAVKWPLIDLIEKLGNRYSSNIDQKVQDMASSNQSRHLLPMAIVKAS
jgi:hypothetical protein